MLSCFFLKNCDFFKHLYACPSIYMLYVFVLFYCQIVWYLFLYLSYLNCQLLRLILV